MPLAGFTVGVTASRRAEEFATLLERRGASVMHAPAIRIIPLADDAELERVTAAIIAAPPEITVATTGIGFRGWIEAADGWGRAEELGRALGASRLLARGPKATGAIRAATLVHALQRTQGKYGMVTMCIGMGQGAAGIFERV